MAVSGCWTMTFIGRKGETQQQKVKILAAATKGRSESKIKQFCNGMLFNRKHGIYFRNNLSQILFYKVKCVCKCLYAIFPSFVVFVETQNTKPGFQCCLVQQFLLRGTQESPGGGSGEANGVSVKQPRDTECCPFYAIELPLHQFYKGGVCV